MWFPAGLLMRMSLGLFLGTFWLTWIWVWVGETTVSFTGVLTGFWKLEVELTGIKIDFFWKLDALYLMWIEELNASVTSTSTLESVAPLRAMWRATLTMLNISTLTLQSRATFRLTCTLVL